MKSYNSIFVVVALFIAVSVETCIAFQTGIVNEVQFCESRNHYILKPKATCCNMTVVEPGIDILEHWGECAVPGDEDESVIKSSWRIYSCVLKKFGEGDSITLEKFAELMTKNYEEKLKQSIMEKAISNTITADYKDSKELNKLRTTYYDIEKEVCSGVMNSEIGKERECMHWEEENHRGGRCCGKMSFPIDTDMKSFLDLHFPLEPLKTTCITLINWMEKFDRWSRITEMMMDNIVLICDLSCHLVNTEDFDVRKLTPEVDVKAIANLMYPNWVSSSVKSTGVDYIIQSINISEIMAEMEQYQFPNWLAANTPTETPFGAKIFVTNTTTKIDSWKYENTNAEIMRRTFPKNITQFPVTACATHKQILAFIRYTLFMDCNKGDAGDTAA